MSSTVVAEPSRSWARTAIRRASSPGDDPQAGSLGLEPPAELGRAWRLDRDAVLRGELARASSRSGRRAGRRVAPCARTESPTVTNAVVSRRSSWGSPPSSTTRRAKTIDAAPRGPNQPRNATVRAVRPCPDHRDRHRQHAHQSEAQHRVERDAPREIAERRAEQRWPRRRRTSSRRGARRPAPRDTRRPLPGAGEAPRRPLRLRRPR